MKEKVRAGSAQHYEWVVSNGKSKIDRVIDFIFTITLLVVVLVCIYVTVKG